MSSLTLNGKTFSIDELKSISFEKGQSAFEKSTLQFCRAWLGGQAEFKIQTSGSTGIPKEITLRREAMEASAQQTISALQLKERDTALICLDTKYIAGQMMLVRSFVLGMNIVAVEPLANPMNQIDQRIDFTALVPYQLEKILNQSPEKLNRVRCAIIGGATVSNSLKEKIRKVKCAIYATYGMTETISHVALQKLNGPDALEYFEVLENVRLKLDERGCLCIKVDYLEEEVITNDLVTLINNKKFKWLGRIDNVINSGGVKIIPEKVEAVFEKILDSLQIKNRFFIAGLPDEKLGQRVVMILEGELIDQTILDKMISEASPHLTKYELPKELKFEEKFIETNTGKVNRIEILKRINDLL